MTRSTSVLDNYPAYEAIIGIEVHVQLTTKSKMFCASARQVSEKPNEHICNICTGAPGSLPVINRQAVINAIRAGLATNCTIEKESSFDRKHYFYPDLPKGYQITQQFKPICSNGFIDIRFENGVTKKIRINRIHMEEDAGKNVHSGSSNESFVDFNRAGTPLLEIVSEPDIASAEQAKLYLKALRSIVQYLGICTGNMEEGAFRADTNISVRKKGASVFGTRVELKNINSFKFIGDAIEYEIERHIQTLENGEQIKQETRLWDTKNHITVSMRSKEEAADYRYFNEPNLPIIQVDDAWATSLKEQLPELPHQKFERLTKECGLSAYEANILVEDLQLANYFDHAHSISKSKQVINLILRDLLAYLKEHDLTLDECKVTPDKLATIAQLLESEKINNRAAKEVFESVAQTGKDPKEIVKEKGLEQIESTEELEAIVINIIENNPDNVQQYHQAPEDRKPRLLGFFVGQAMKKTEGKGNPKLIQQLLKKHLG